MSNYGVFESAFTDDHDERTAQADREALLRSAIFDAREQFGSFLASAKDKSDFKDRVALVKNDMMKVVANSLMPVPGVMRKVEGALKPDFEKKASALDTYYEATDPGLLGALARQSNLPLEVEPTHFGNPTEYGLELISDHGRYMITYVSQGNIGNPHPQVGWGVSVPGPRKGQGFGYSKSLESGIQFAKRAVAVLEDYFQENGISASSKKATRETGDAHADAMGALKKSIQDFAYDAIDSAVKSGEYVWNYDPEVPNVVGLQSRMGNSNEAFVVVYLSGDVDGFDDFEVDEGWLMGLKQANTDEWGAAQDAFSDWLEDEYGVEEDEEAPEGALEEYLQKMPHMRKHFSSVEKKSVWIDEYGDDEGYELTAEGVWEDFKGWARSRGETPNMGNIDAFLDQYPEADFIDEQIDAELMLKMDGKEKAAPWRGLGKKTAAYADDWRQKEILDAYYNGELAPRIKGIEFDENPYNVTRRFWLLVRARGKQKIWVPASGEWSGAGGRGTGLRELKRFLDNWGKSSSTKEAEYEDGDFWEGDENPVYADPVELEDWIDEDEEW